MSKLNSFNKNIGRLGVLTAITLSLLKCNSPSKTQKNTTQQSKKAQQSQGAQRLKNNIAENIVSWLKAYDIKISKDQTNAIISVLGDESHNLNESNIQNFIDILTTNDIFKDDENGKIVVNADAFTTEGNKTILNNDVVEIDVLKESIADKKSFISKKEDPQEPKKANDSQKGGKKIDQVASDKKISSTERKVFTDKDWEQICSGNKFTFEDIKAHIPDNCNLKHDTVMNIIKTMDDISVDKVLTITKLFDDFKFKAKDISEILGSLNDNSVNDFKKLNGDQKHKSQDFLMIINKLKSKLLFDDALKLKEYLYGNLSINDFKNFSGKLEVPNEAYNELILNYCEINDINKITVLPFKVEKGQKMPLSVVSELYKSNKINNTQNFIKVFGKISTHEDYEKIKEFINPTSNLQDLVSIFDKGLNADDLYDIWDKYFIDQVRFDEKTHHDLTKLVKERETLDLSKFKSKKTTITFAEWLKSNNDAEICAIDKVVFSDSKGTSISVDDAQMKTALDKINKVKNDTNFDKNKIVTFITNAQYQDKLNKDHIRVLKDIFDTDFKANVLNNKDYTKFNITIKDLADTIGNQSLISSEVKTLFSQKCNDWKTEKVKVDIVNRINEVSGHKELEYVLGILSDEKLAIAQAIEICKKCTGNNKGALSDIATLSKALVASNDRLDAFFKALKNDDKEMQKVFGEFKNAKLTAAEANKILKDGNITKNSSNDIVTAKEELLGALSDTTLQTVFGALNGVNLTLSEIVKIAKELGDLHTVLADDATATAFMDAIDENDKKIKTVFEALVSAGVKDLTAENAVKIAEKCNDFKNGGLNNADAANAFINVIKEDERNFQTVFGAFKGTKLTAENANKIVSAINLTHKTDKIVDAITELLGALSDNTLQTVFGALNGAKLTAENANKIVNDQHIKKTSSKDIANDIQALLDALDNIKCKTVFGALKGANLTAEDAAKIAQKCDGFKDGGLNDAVNDFIDVIKNDTTANVATVFKELKGANLTAGNAVKIAKECSDFKTGGFNSAAAATYFINAITENNKNFKTVFGAFALNDAKLTVSELVTIAAAYDDLNTVLADDDAATAFINAINENDKNFKTVFGAFKDANLLTAANAVKIAAACGDLNIWLANAAAEFINAIKKDERNFKTVFGAFKGTKLTAENANKIFNDQNITDKTPDKIVDAIKDLLDALDNTNLKTVFGALNGANLKADDANKILKDGNITDKTPDKIVAAIKELLDALSDRTFKTVFVAFNGVKFTVSELVTIAKKLDDLNTVLADDDAFNDFMDAINENDKKIKTVFKELNGVDLTAKNAAKIFAACGDFNTGLADADADAATVFINAIKKDDIENKVSKVFEELVTAGVKGDQGLTAENAAKIFAACGDFNTGLADATAATNFVNAIKNTEKEIKTVFEALVLANVKDDNGLTAENAAKIFAACGDFNTGLAAADAVTNFIAAIKNDDKKIAKVFKELVTANVKDDKGLTAENAAKIACALNNANKGYDNKGKNELVTKLTDPNNQDDLEWFFKALKHHDENDENAGDDCDTMYSVSNALKGNADDYSLAQILKILVHCCNFDQITATMQDGCNLVTLNQTTNKNNLKDLTLSSLFNNENNKFTSLKQANNMFTAWELFHIMAIAWKVNNWKNNNQNANNKKNNNQNANNKKNNNQNANNNIQTIFDCLQNEYRKLDIVFYELANCKMGKNYTYSDQQNGPSDGQKGNLSITRCFAFINACYQANNNALLTNVIQQNNYQAIIDEQKGGYSTTYLNNTDRYKKLWLCNRDNPYSTKQYDTFPINNLGNGNSEDTIDTLYANIVAVCDKCYGYKNSFDFQQMDWKHK